MKHQRINNVLLGNSQFRVLVVTVLLSILSLNLVQSQDRDNDNDDIVLLRDGSVYKGQIIEENREYLYMVILDGQTIDVPQREVRRVLSGENYLFHVGGRYHYTKGFFWNVELGFNIAPEESTSEHFSLLLGYRFNKRISAGMGLGSELSTTQVAGQWLVTQFNSYFVYGRYYLADVRRRPFAYARLGYGNGPSAEFESGRHSGGFQAQGGFGIHFASRKRSRFVLSVGYHTQYTNGEQLFLDGFGNEIKIKYEDFWVNNMILKFGIEFR